MTDMAEEARGAVLQVIAQEWISVDGYAAGTASEQDVIGAATPAANAASQEWNISLLAGIDEVLLGRRTYELFASYWPAADEPIAGPLNAARKTVCSRTLTTAPWPGGPDAAVVPDALSYVRGKRDQAGRVLIWGSLSLVHALLAAGELDELDLFVAPVALGAGAPLFPWGPLPLQLLASEYWDGTLHVRYGTGTPGL